jgi:protein tyrosine/serine phosphatase
MLEATSRWIDLDGAVNARVVVPGRLVRTDNLQDLTERDVTALVDEQGVRTVIDLRTDNERALEGPAPLDAVDGVEVLALSLYPETGGNTDLDAETIKPWESIAQHPDDAEEMPAVRAYYGYLRHRPDNIVAALRAIARTDGAALVHCAAGKDRTGVVVALALELAGVPRAEIEADYVLTRERIEQIVARLASSPTYAPEMDTTDPDRHAPRDGAMLRVLELLDEREGSPEAYLRKHGLEGDAIAALQALGA